MLSYCIAMQTMGLHTTGNQAKHKHEFMKHEFPMPCKNYNES